MRPYEHVVSFFLFTLTFHADPLGLQFFVQILFTQEFLNYINFISERIEKVCVHNYVV